MKTVCLCILTLLAIACSTGFQQSRMFPPTNHLKLCLMGDTGMNSNEQAQVAKALGEEDCDNIYILGDIIYPDGLESLEDPLIEENFFRYYRPVHLKGKAPVFHIALGNHDYAGDPDVWTEMAKTNPMIYAPARYYLQEFSGVCILTLDTNLPIGITRALRQFGQLSWLQSIQKKMNRKHCPLKIALGHHFYKNSAKKRHGDAKGHVKRFLEDHVIGQFDYYLSGHEHVLSYEGNERGTELYISGAGGTPADKQLPGYVTMDIIKTGNNFKVRTIMRRIHKDKTVNEKDSIKSFTAGS